MTIGRPTKLSGWVSRPTLARGGQLAAGDGDRRLPDPRRAARGRRRDQQADIAERLPHLRLKHRTVALRLQHRGGGEQGARQQPVARRRIELARAGAQRFEMQVPARRAGQDERGGAGLFRPWKRASRGRAERFGDRCHRRQGLRVGVVGKPAVEHRDVCPEWLGERWRDRGHRPLGAGEIAAIVALDRVVDRRQISDAARKRAEVIEIVDEREGAGARQPAERRLEPEQSAERGWYPDRAVGV